ncbi:MAG: sugar transferase, partial [Solirubrobacterales bacterium]|nr:sugar transferase [Solirubrobacterales bacterium]
ASLSEVLHQPRPSADELRRLPRHDESAKVLYGAPAGRAAARRAVVHHTLLKADVVGILLAVLVTSLASAAWHLREGADLLVLGILLLPAWLVTSLIYRLNLLDAERADHGTANEVVRVAGALLAAVWLAAVVSGLFGPEPAPSLQELTILVVVGAALMALVRMPARALVRRHPAFRQRTIVVGANTVGRLLAEKLRRHREYGIDFIGFLDDSPDLVHATTSGDVLGPLETLEQTVQSESVDRVFITPCPARSEEVLTGAARRLERMGVQVDIVPALFELVGPRAAFHTIEGLPMIGLPPRGPSRSTAVAKRALDVTLAAGGLVVLSPLLMVVALCVRLDSPGPVLYRRELVGRGRRQFAILKFRTMRLEACRGAAYGGASAETAFLELLSDPSHGAEFHRSYKFQEDPRVTKIGALLRRTSLDELPQLWNVVRGELSLVGPRAVGVEEYDDLTFADRHAGPRPYWEFDRIRPGLTGYWQINGRSSTTYAERLWLDEMYVTSLSIRLDLLILGRTVRELFARRQAY